MNIFKKRKAIKNLTLLSLESAEKYVINVFADVNNGKCLNVGYGLNNMKVNSVKWSYEQDIIMVDVSFTHTEGNETFEELMSVWEEPKETKLDKDYNVIFQSKEVELYGEY